MSTKKNRKPDFSENAVLARLSENLNTIMARKKIEPNPFAKELGVLPTVIYRILNQETTPKIHVVARLAHELGVSIDDLVAVAE